MLENKQVSWYELIDILKQRWLIELIVAVIILMVGFFSLNLNRPTATPPAKYQASSQVLLTLQENQQQVVMDQMPNPQYVKTFAEVARTNLVVKPVKKKLATQNISLSLRNLKKQVTVYTNDNNSLLDVEVAADNRAEAKKIARTYAKVTSQKVAPVMGLGHGRVVEAAQVKKNRVSQKLSFKRVFGLIFVAIVLGGASGFLVEYCDRRIRSHYFVTTFLGYEPLQLSSIPTATELATVRNTLDIVQPKQQVITLQAPAATQQFTTFGQQLADQYAQAGQSALVVDLATDAATLQQLASDTVTATYKKGAVTTLAQSTTAEQPQLTLQQLAKCLEIFRRDFPLVILLAAGVQLVGNVQLASHLADSRMLLLQQGRSSKKAALQLQQQAHNRAPFTAVLYLKA
uniref:Tyrosine-protein kinase transmembrane modulator EpsC n=1 Tax=Loigolactobacillus rennini TaxID=238013 RepID=A0A1K2I4S7_9LACO|nr:Tyrosine-protein kinase transmembrane modulator EpsC [Loigolactobacillus rennini]